MTLGHRSTWQCTPHALAPKSRGKEKDVGRSGDLDTLLWGGPWSPDSQKATDTVERSLVGIPALLLASLQSKLWNLSKPWFPYLPSVVGKTYLW